MIIYNNKTGEIILNVKHTPNVKLGIDYYRSQYASYKCTEHTEIKDQPLTFIFKPNGSKFTGKVVKIEDNVIYIQGHGSFELDKVAVKIKDTSKFDQLHELWKSGKSQINKDIKLHNFLRLVDGDLSHIGDAMLAGDAIFNFGSEEVYYFFNSLETNAYTIKKKQITLKFDADLVDELMRGSYISDLLGKLQTQIKEQL